MPIASMGNTHSPLQICSCAPMGKVKTNKTANVDSINLNIFFKDNPSIRFSFS
jgi:hypothetical protein